MAALASTLAGRTDSLARRSTEDETLAARTAGMEGDGDAAEPTNPDQGRQGGDGPAAPAAPGVRDTRASSSADAPEAGAGDEPPPPGSVPSAPADGLNGQPGEDTLETASTPSAVSGGVAIDSPGADLLPSRAFAGPEGRLGASGEQVVKWTLELAPAIVMALNVWERDETKRLGERVYRERLIDDALDRLPENLDGILATVAGLPAPLRGRPGQQFGTRVRASVRDKLLSLRPELRVAGVTDVRIRDVYTAAVYHYLRALGVHIADEPATPRM